MNKYEIAIFGGGCFWCTEAIFQRLRGVISVTPGYAGGHRPSPTYNDVSSGMTGHAEVVKIEFEPEEIGYADLLKVFWELHDPTTPNRQGYDVGSQYRSIILTTSDEQEKVAVHSRKKLDESKVYKHPVVTEICALDKFYDAETYHRNYYNANSEKPYCQVIISPKLTHLREKFARQLKAEPA